MTTPAPGPDRRQGFWRNPRLRGRLLEPGFLVPAAAYLALFFGNPVVKNVVMGFQEHTNATFFTGEAPWVGLSSYAAVIGSAVFSKALVNTALFTVGSIAGHRRRLPLSVIVTDFYKLDPQEYPDPQAMRRELDDLGVRLMVSIWPTISPLSENSRPSARKGCCSAWTKGLSSTAGYVTRA